jgi:tetratricopeptide (TPR) repeat protein
MRDRLAGSLELLTGGARDLPARQQTLRATLDWSEELLAASERTLLARLSVFAGGCSLEAAQAICGDEGDVIDTLASLVDHSLVRRTGSRYAMLETVREFAEGRLEQSGEADALRRRHADYFADLAEGIATSFTSADDAPQEVLFERLDADHDNLRSALSWTESGPLELEVRLAGAMHWYWLVRGDLSEARRVYEGILERIGDGDPTLRATALARAGSFPYRQGDTDVAKAQWEEALELFRSNGDQEGIARCTAELGGVAVSEGELDRARALYEEGAELFRAQDNRIRQGIALANLGAIANMQHDYEMAARVESEAAAIQRELGDRDGLGVTLHNLARSLLADGRPEESREALAESLAVAQGLGYRELIAYCLAGAAEFALADGDPEQAARLAAGSAKLFDEIGVPIAGQEAEGQMQVATALREQLETERLEELRAEGETASVEELAASFTAAAQGTGDP